jgi:hypothetical protein
LTRPATISSSLLTPSKTDSLSGCGITTLSTSRRASSKRSSAGSSRAERDNSVEVTTQINSLPPLCNGFSASISRGYQWTNRTSSKKYSVDFQQLTQIRKNIFHSPPPVLPLKNLNFSRNLLSPNNLPPNAFSLPASPIYGETIFLPSALADRKSKIENQK